MTAVLVVDDDPSLLKVLKITLQANGYAVTTATDGQSALLAATQHPFSLVILDLGLPDIDGITVIKQLRSWNQAPILVLSARHTSDDKVEALDAGADDYLTKPFGPDELLARLRALLRRTSEQRQEPVVVTDSFTVDLAKHRVIRDGNDVRLTPTRMEHSGAPCPEPREAHHATAAALGRLGPGVHEGRQLPARLHGPASPQTRTRHRQPPAPPHRGRNWLQIPAIAGRD